MSFGRKFSFALLGLLLTSVPLHAQRSTGVVVGRVTDATSQQPLVGATVIVGERGALTDANGKFTIGAVPTGTQTARAILLGYKEETKQVTVSDGQVATVDFAMSEQAVQLAQLVVVGYGTQRAGAVTGAVKQVNSSEFNTGRVVSPEMLIQSKAAGVYIEDRNEPGAGMAIRIRGTTSVNAASDPLYVVDGVPMGTGSGGGLSAGRNAMNYLNPNDIESITVLKDAASASIYGANASNGVVLITTKRANRRTLGMEYTGSISGSQITRKPDMLNAAEFRTAVTQHSSNANQLANDNTNWFDLVTRNALGQEHNLAITSMGDNSDLRVSLGYLNQDGIIRGTTIDRLSAGVNFTQRLLDDNLNIRTSLKGSRVADQFTPGGVLSNAAQMGPTQPVYDPTSITGYANWPGNQFTSADNPLEILALGKDDGRTWRSVGNVQTEYRLPFFQQLKGVVNLGYDITKATREQFSPTLLHRELKGAGTHGRYYRRDETFQNGLFEGYLNYNAGIHSLPGTFDVTAGYSYSQGRGEYPSVTVTQLSSDALELNGIPGSAATPLPTMWVDENKLISFFGRANYNLKDRYILSASLRRDGSSRFGPGNAWGTFPSFSAAWRISEESFMKNNGLLDELKLRGSWGKVGNQSFANYQQYTTYTYSDATSQVWFDGQFVTTIRPNPADKNLRWEETKAYDAGFDFAIGRLNGSFDYYNKDTNGLIFTVPVAVGVNLSNFVTTNIGTMNNKGFEVSLSTKLLDGGRNGFNWTVDFNGSHNKNELTQITPFTTGVQRIETGDVAGGVGTKIQVLTPGVPVYSFYVYKHKMVNGKPLYQDVAGLDSNGKVTNTPDGSIKPEDLYEDLNGDGKVNDSDRRPFHDPAPKWILGHSSYLTYGKFDGAFTLRAYLGNYTYNNVASNLGAYAEVTRGSPYNLHRSVLETGFETPQYQSDYYIEDASFLRMDNISVGYNLTYRGQPMRIYGSVQNAFTMTGYSGVDPTAGLNGIDNNIYPRSRTFAGGVTVKF